MKLFAGLFLLLAVAPAAFAKLEITNVQPAHGMLGPVRDSDDVYPLDEYVVRFQLNGVKTTAEGKTDCELAIRLVNAAGKAVVDTKATLQRVMSLGGDSVPTFAVVTFPAVAPAGEYKLTVSVRDRVASETASLERKLTCKTGEFHLLAPRFTHDPEGKIPAGTTGVAGESLYFRFKVAGYDKSKKLSLTMKAEVLDSAGKPVDAKPIIANADTTDPEKLASLIQANFTGTLALNRVGEFKLKITVEDNVAKKTVTFETPVKVLAP
ncbi:hypothetical protein [Zavarzinella formosa]|uniref:hypothetical protein n=1 Tax=Zavarzinella formosa TaxID=360055 RepID=UPI0002E6B1AD|nr:hypothetical protein [Zavarzinella formosa]